jgi:RNA polymerase sigma-70 factor (ECF subfamily)
LVTLDEQDRSGWNPALIAEGHALVRACVQTNRPGPYRIQAAVSAVHTSSREFRYTGWSALATLYDQLYDSSPGTPPHLPHGVDSRGGRLSDRS